MNKTVKMIEELYASFAGDANKAVGGNKAAGARARKTSLAIEKALKEFRKVSIEEAK